MNICQNENCKKETNNKKFCSRSCVAFINNKNRIGKNQSEETKYKISLRLNKNQKINYTSICDKNLKTLGENDFELLKKLNYLNRELKKKKNIYDKIEKLKNEDYSKLGYDRLRLRIIIDQNYKCKHCGIDKWRGEELSFEINHIDGNNRNNDPINLEALCPNCHSLTPNWRGKNAIKFRKEINDDELLEALKTSKNTRQALIKVGLTPKGGSYLRCKKLLKSYFENHNKKESIIFL